MAHLGPQKGPVLAPNRPFLGPLYTRYTLWPSLGPLLGPQGPQKGQFWPKMSLFGAGNIFCWNIAMWGV